MYLDSPSAQNTCSKEGIKMLSDKLYQLQALLFTDLYIIIIYTIAIPNRL